MLAALPWLLKLGAILGPIASTLFSTSTKLIAVFTVITGALVVYRSDIRDPLSNRLEIQTEINKQVRARISNALAATKPASKCEDNSTRLKTLHGELNDVVSLMKAEVPHLGVIPAPTKGR